MSEQIKVLPDQGAEDSAEKPPSLRSHLSEAPPSLSIRPSDPAPSLHSRPLDEAPTLPSRPLEPPPSLQAPSSEPRPSLQPASSKRNPTKPGASSAPRSRPAGPRKKVVDVTINWFSATIGLLFTCAILFSLVAIMSSQVARLSKTSEERTKVLQLQIVILSEILQQLQIGKVPTCSVCRIQWLQHADNCYLFRKRQMSWPSGIGFCEDESSSLPVINSTEEMDFLRLESKKYFNSYSGRPKFYKFWMGLKYEPSIGKSLWTDGSVLNNKQLKELIHKGCLYLQNGEFRSQPCSEDAYVVCKAKVQLGWN